MLMLKAEKYDLLRVISSVLSNKSVLITGASGFVGRSILRLLADLDRKSPLNLYVSAQYRKMVPCLESEIINQHIIADIGMPLNCERSPDIVFHCATPASALLNVGEPQKMLTTNMQAMDWILSDPKVLTKSPIVVFTSSGAVYGSQHADLERIPEGWSGAPDPLAPGIAYAEGKRIAEFLLSESGRRGDVQPVIARLFAFSGVGLPLDRHFAIGNFVRNALCDEQIVVRGDGKTIRSYLDSEDMAVWLLKAAITRAADFPLHIGSAQPISISTLAELVSRIGFDLTGRQCVVSLQNQESLVDGNRRYVPDNTSTMNHLSVAEWKSLDQSICEMMASEMERKKWHS